MKKENIVFLVGVFVFGYFYESIKDLAPNSTIFVGTALIYLLLLRWLCKKVKSVE
jgi:biotin transporter BioY